jgi:hypothetical protein
MVHTLVKYNVKDHLEMETQLMYQIHLLNQYHHQQYSKTKKKNQ